VGDPAVAICAIERASPASNAMVKWTFAGAPKMHSEE
jgi:hypothetical protein